MLDSEPDGSLQALPLKSEARKCQRGLGVHANISDVAERHYEDPKAEPPQKHFLGPIVLDQIRSALGEVDRRLIIDGQQRLTTLQLLLHAAQLVFNNYDAADEAEELADLVANRGKAAVGEGRYKVMPSRRDQPAFFAALDGEEVPSVFCEATEFFAQQIDAWVSRDDDASGADLHGRVEALRRTLDSLLYVVSINLDPTDNAQVIFETLNARGTGLGALDLVKNAALLAAERQGLNAQKLNDELWEPTFERISLSLDQED